MIMKEVYLISGARTPVGSFNGMLSSFTAPQLGSIVIKEAVRRANVKPETIDEVIIGCVLQGGLGQAPGTAGIYRCRDSSIGIMYDY